MDSLSRALRCPRSRRAAWRELRMRAKARFVADLRERFALRLHVVVILAGAVLAGVSASALALDIGLGSMLWRSLLGLGVAYLAFLGLVRLWIDYVQGWRPDVDPNDALDVFDALDRCSNAPAAFESGGGRFGGGGANGSWGDGCSAADATGGGSAGFDLDDGVVVLLLIVLAVVACGGIVYMVAVGPGILTEAAFETILAGSLARRTGWTARSGSWLSQTVRSTVVPFVVVAVFTAGIVTFAQELCPAATRMRDVVECVRR